MTFEPLVGKQTTSVQLATAPINIWEGSVRSSKTVCSLMAWLRYVRTAPPGNLAMIGKTERTLRRNIVDVIVQMVGPKRCKVNWGDGEMLLFGRRIYLAGANNAASVGKIQGLTLAGSYGDEITLWPEEFWSMLVTRHSVPGARIFGSCNPDNPNHWLMKNWLKQAATWLRHDGTIEQRTVGDATPEGHVVKDLARFSFRLRDNPTLTERFIAMLESQFSGLWALRFIEGLWTLGEGSIYDMLDLTEEGGRHLRVNGIERDAAGNLDVVQWVLAADHGTTNPTHAVLAAVCPDRIHIAREWVWDSKVKQSQATTFEQSAALRTWLASLAGDPEIRRGIVPDIVVIDPAAADFVLQLQRDSWFGLQLANNAVLPGIRAVSSLLAANRMTLDPKGCPVLFGQLQGYVWDPKAAEKGEEKPVKIDDHGPDALRYLVMSLWSVWRHWLTADVAAALDPKDHVLAA